MIEVFATDVNSPDEAKRIKGRLLVRFPGTRINFDLQDCDRVLRVEGSRFTAPEVIGILKEEGFLCRVLED